MESAARLDASLKDAADIFGGGAIACVCRELTKLHETFDRAPLAELAEKVGYQSEAAFSRAFKKVVGVAPGSLRRQGSR